MLVANSPLAHWCFFQKTHKIIFAKNQQINDLKDFKNTKFDEQLLKNHFLNTPTDQKRTPTQLEDGDLLVVVNENYLNDIQPFIDWKNQKGIKNILKYWLKLLFTAS